MATGTLALPNMPTFDSAEPYVPITMAPAWPIRFSLGAALPAMYATTGLSNPVSMMRCASSSSASPPISPTTTTPRSPSMRRAISNASVRRVPLIGSPPIPIVMHCPNPACVSALDIS